MSKDERIYFKVGFTKGRRSRQVTLQAGNARPFRAVFQIGPINSETEAKKIEKEVHQLLDSYRVRGEWFDVNPLTLRKFHDWCAAKELPLIEFEKGTYPSEWRRRAANRGRDTLRSGMAYRRHRPGTPEQQKLRFRR